MAISGGSVSFSGGPTTYSVTYNAPSYSTPSGATNISFTVSSAGPSSVSCGSSASQTYRLYYYYPAVGEWVEEFATISGTAPACPPAPTDGKIDVYNGTTWVSVYPKVYNGTTWVTGTVYTYNGSAWVKSTNS
jgi:hypothetical protein